MSTLFDTLVIGLQNGAIYSLVALGVALVYRSTRVLNFAQGEVGTTAAFIAYVIVAAGTDGVVRGRLWWASVVAVAAGGAIGVLVYGVVRRVSDTTGAAPLVTTVAVALLLVGVQVVLFQVRGRRFPRLVDGAPCMESRAGECVRELTIGTVVIPWHTIVVLGVLAGAVVALSVFFRTSWGAALLASADDPYAAELSGVSARTMGALAWGTAGILAALSGVLGAGVFNQLTPGLMMTTFLVPGFVAAVLGGMTSMVGAVVGGLLVGVSVSGANQIVQSLDLAVPGPPQIAVLAVLVIVLLVRPQGLFGRA